MDGGLTKWAPFWWFMQLAIVDISILGLLVFLFAAIAKRNPDDRLRLWVAAWLCILIHFALGIWSPVSGFQVAMRDSLSVITLALAATLFVISTMILKEGRNAGLRLGGLLALFTLPCLAVAVIVPQGIIILATLIVTRQTIAILLAARRQHDRPSISSIVIPLCILTATWMLYGLFHGHSEIVVVTLLSEMYFVCAAGFWMNGWERTLALKTTCIGFTAWAAAFPLSIGVEQFLPNALVGSVIWSIPKFCVAIGMILMVLEEDTRSARALTEEYRLTFETNPHPLWIVDKNTLRFLAVNHAALNKHGYTREEFMKLRIPDLLEPAALPGVLREIGLSRARTNRATRHLRKDGTIMPMDITAHEIIFHGRSSRFVLGIDVTEREALQQQVIHLSGHDILTGLPNRTLFEEQLHGAVTRAAESQEKLAILCLDIDHFKNINDTYGTWVGDECLRYVAATISSSAKAMDLVARLASDEFVLVLTGLKSAVPAEHVLSEIKAAFRDPLVVAGLKVRISVSLGLALCPDDGVTVAALWRGAESALSRARATGGGQAIWLSPELRTATEQQVELEAYMREQLEEHGFYLVYQPVYALDGSVQALEALIRLAHPVLGTISPGRFIPIAEEVGLIVPLGAWVIESCCRQLREWKEQGMRLVPIALNVSGLQLMQADFATRLIEMMTRFEIPTEWIKLEITESTAMLDLAEVMVQIRLLKDYGIRFAIDDFGTGHSSLNRLDKLPISFLKIDRSFTKHLCVAGSTESIVKAIISMARALRIRVIAEGVEDEDQIIKLRELGCDYMQGFLLSRPVDAQVIPALVEQKYAMPGNVLAGTERSKERSVLRPLVGAPSNE